MSGPRRVPIHRALASPPMLLGCDRNKKLLLLTCAGGLFTNGLHNLNTSVMVYSALVIAGGIPFLVHLGKIDPQFLKIYSRARFYRSRYSATGRWDVTPRSVRKW